MGAIPDTALNISCFPSITDKNKEYSSKIIIGANDLDRAGCVSLGGHTVDNNIKFGFAVTGTYKNILCSNKNANVGDNIPLTKPIGIGIITSILKQEKDINLELTIIDNCTKLNNIGIEYLNYGVICMTDVSGFGLVGHLIEVAEAFNIGIELFLIKFPF